jgi:signal transduction histidine kinase
MDLKGIGLIIIGGGAFCRRLLEFFFDPGFEDRRPVILGVADLDHRAPAMDYARARGIATAVDYRDLLGSDGLQLVLELTGDNTLAATLAETLPRGVKLVDHFEAASLWRKYRIEEEKKILMAGLDGALGDPDKTRELIQRFTDNLEDIARQQARYAADIRRGLMEKELMVSQIVRGSTIPTFVIDQNHTIICWNRALEKLTGYMADEMVGTTNQAMPFWGEKRPTMADVILDRPDAAMLGTLYGDDWRKSALIEDAFEAEHFFPALGENGRWCFFTAAPIQFPDGTVMGAIETLQDTTASKALEAERAQYTRETMERERTLFQIIQGLTFPTFVLDADHVITHWNKALEKLTGLPAHEMVGTSNQWMSFWESRRPSMADVILDQLGEAEIMRLYKDEWRKSTLIEGAYEAEHFFPALGDGGKWCFFTAAPLKSSDGRLIGAIETFWDTTEEKKIAAECEAYTQRLAESEKALFEIIQGSTIPTFVIDADHVVAHWNRALEKLSGVSAESMLGTRNHWRAFRAEPRPLMADVILDQCEDGEVCRLYGHNWRKSALIEDAFEAEEFFPDLGTDGKWCFFTAAPIHSPDGTLIGAIETLWDRTEERRLERELINSERLSAIGQTVAGMAHCIKNILHGFKGGSYLVDIGLDRNDSAKLKSGWDAIQRNIGRVSELVLDLLSYSKEREPEYVSCRPTDIADDVCELMDAVAQKHGVRIVKDDEAGIGSFFLDPKIVHRALLNLVSNAIDACIFDDNPDKAHRVVVRTMAEEGNFVSFEIEDNGSGMDEAVKERLFRSFFSTKGAKGTGLGLLVTKKIIEEHGGVIEVVSQLGKGTTFAITLPTETRSGEGQT